MFSHLKTILLIASVLTIPLTLGGCKSRQTRSVSSAPPATVHKSDQFYRGERTQTANRPKPLPSGPSRHLENPSYNNQDPYRTSTSGPMLPLPAPPVED